MIEINEHEIIETILGSAGRLPKGYMPIGDDVAAIPAKRGSLVIKTDMLVARTDVPPQMTTRQAARKAVAMCVSDFTAKGVEPDSFLVSLGLPRGSSGSAVDELAAGLADARREWNLKLVGGDTNEADELTIDCVMIGFSDHVVRRSGASPGQLIVTSGLFGYPASGLKILLQGASAEASFARKASRSVLRPMPRLRLGLLLSKYLSSSMDSSDGLAICLHSIAEASGVGMSLSRLPYRRDVQKFASMNGYPIEDLVLYGGEEFEIVGTIEEKKFGEALRRARSVGEDLTIIGETTKKNGQLTFNGREIEKRGWIHLA